MHWFYVKKSQISGGCIRITGPDVNHIKNVLRMEPGERLVLCDGEGTDFYCRLVSIDSREILARIEEWNSSEGELPSKIYLFQGIPKKDKMDLIVQKAVELGAFEIIPVAMKRCVAKIEDEKKEEKKRARWQGIAEAAAKQSGRGLVPQIRGVLSMREAAEMAGKLSFCLLPYEQAEGMELSRAVIGEACEHDSIALFIGPEGGFDDGEAALLKEKTGARPFSLGKRILRTETAGLAVLSILMFEMETRRPEAPRDREV